jgi:hypothetical protein
MHVCLTEMFSFWTLDGKLNNSNQSCVVGTLHTGIHNINCSKTFALFQVQTTSPNSQAYPGEDLTPDYMNILGMIFSMCGLMMRVSIFEYVAAIFMYRFFTVIIYNCH